MEPKIKKRKLIKCREKANGCFIEGYAWTSNIQLQRCCQNANCVLQRTVANRKKAEEKKAKSDRATTRERKKALKTLPQLLNEAQTYCNRYIMLLDAKEACISCDTRSPVNYDAGHYIAIGRDPHKAIRFHRFNINRQCSWNCNNNLSGNAIEYRKRLVKKIGVENVEWLENHHDYYRFTREDAIEIKEHFQELIRLHNELTHGICRVRRNQWQQQHPQI